MPRAITQREMDGVLAIPLKKRFGYFLKEVAGERELWTLLLNGGIVTMGDNDGNVFIPLWPFREFAMLFVKVEWSDAEPERIDIYRFLEKWIEDAKEESVRFGVFPTPNGGSIPVSPDDLRGYIEFELSQIEDPDCDSEE
ncbi:MAG: DUF2750 domain-containing protein [Phycisphaeraceae bacterium]|nr:DUF2750 domain-containing protein [Phycisphaerales bacterium]MCB9842797.1 DUF2750 domain-containing protein [Phycisphaeraceae bacterium]